MQQEKSRKALRGDKLREHILYSAKEVFLEMGLERASMDLIASRAGTSKRTLYAHYENKEKLYLAFLDLVSSRLLDRLKTPADYAGDPAEALTGFCARFLESLLFVWTVRVCRLMIAEAARFPQASAKYFDLIFTETQQRVAAYLKQTFKLKEKASAEAAQELVGRVVYPRFARALFGVDELSDQLDEDRTDPDFDLKPVRKAVMEVIEALENR